jgi:hypothetical protein
MQGWRAMNEDATATTPVYEERLWPSAAWWLLPLGAGASLGLVVSVVAPVAVAALVALAVALPVGWALAAWAAVVRVDASGLRAGRALLPWSAVGEVRPLDAETARRIRGPGADPRAYLLLRSYLPRAVVVDLIDPADPTPYWYVSTRRPGDLAAALTTGPSRRRTISGDG